MICKFDLRIRKDFLKDGLEAEDISDEFLVVNSSIDFLYSLVIGSHEFLFHKLDFFEGISLQ